MSSAVRSCAVIGSPIDHSLSPALHTAAYRELALPWVYGRVDVPAGQLARFVDEVTEHGLDDVPCGGLSVTMPGKAEALARASSADDRARVLGAANTLVPRYEDERIVEWRAYNTDVDGITGAYAQHGVEHISDQHCLIIGAGGTAAASVAAMRAMGAASVTVLARNLQRAQPLVGMGAQLDCEVQLVPWAQGHDAIRSADLIASTVPPGAADTVAEGGLRHGQVVLDAVYAGGETALLRQAQAAGATAVGGVHMLLHQAIEQVHLMTGRRPSIAAMRAALP